MIVLVILQQKAPRSQADDASKISVVLQYHSKSLIIDTPNSLPCISHKRTLDQTALCFKQTLLMIIPLLVCLAIVVKVLVYTNELYEARKSHS